MAQIRVLVVDDSSVVRRTVLAALADESSLRVVATAVDGHDALEQMKRHTVDVVITDLEMPVMGGLELTGAIVAKYPKVPVIVLAGAAGTSRATVAALAAGAVDYVTKPAGADIDATTAALRQALVPKIQLHAARKAGIRHQSTALVGESTRSAGHAHAAPVRTHRPGTRIDAIGIAVSTGGPQALSQLVRDLPASLNVPILIVQHMPATFTRQLAERLATHCPLDVREAAGGEIIAGKGAVYIAPGGQHLVAEKTGTTIRLRLDDSPPEQSCKPSADVLLRSMAAVWGANMMCVVMTGMGQDGTLGGRAVADAGGLVLAQDEASSVVWGMPGSAVRAGIVSEVVALDRLGATIVKYVSRGAKS